VPALPPMLPASALHKDTNGRRASNLESRIPMLMWKPSGLENQEPRKPLKRRLCDRRTGSDHLPYLAS
jgi:hypothetical protein